MRKKLLYCLVLIFCLVPLCLNGEDAPKPENAESSFKDGIAAQVNGEIITKSEVEVVAYQIKKDKKDVIKGLIEGRLFYQAALAEKIEVTEKELDKRLEKLMERYGGRQKFIGEVLRVYKITYEEYREELRRDMLKNKYVMIKSSGANKPDDQYTEMDTLVDTFVSPKEIRDYFEAHKSDYTGKPKILVKQIILKFQDSDTKSYKKSIGEALLPELDKGKSIEDLAAKYSDVPEKESGQDKYMTENDFPEKIREAVFKLEKGKYSSLLETENDFRIVQVYNRINTAEGINSPEVQEHIKQIIQNAKTMEGMKKLRAQLMKKAEIWIDSSFEITAESLSAE
ncbi:MAG: peptidyl-prolyl cis-trans isomerase [Planctomycetes bacterium]|nr:peptidyl-prolyl cis-trans isomerase [Planctomycetota bacterium]